MHGERRGHERIVGDGDGAPARIAIQCAEGVELLEVHVCHPGLLAERAHCALFQRFIHAQCPTGDRPLTLKRRRLALDEQHLQVVVAQRQDHYVHRDEDLRRALVSAFRLSTNSRLCREHRVRLYALLSAT